MRALRLALCLAAATVFLPATTFYLTVAGLGGEDDYDQRFSAWADDLDKIFREIGGDVQVRTLRGDAATQEGLRDALQEIAGQARPGDALALTMIGHGSHDGRQYKFNLPGPDITDVELAALLEGIRTNRQLIANMTSASGGSLPVLQRENRTVVTATKSGTEKNAVVFARYWIAALKDAAADADKNEVISALEAYLYARRKTTDFYISQKRLSTEHALLEDTGRGEGVREPSAENGQGLHARQFPLLRIGQTQLAAQDPAKRELLERKESIEQQIDKLKYEKAAMPYDEYRESLTELLLELARTQAELDQ